MIAKGSYSYVKDFKWFLVKKYNNIDKQYTFE